MQKKKIVIIAGPTASGKTGLAIELARAFNAEIISADSMQVYKFMDIGTAKPSFEERSLVRHHLIDVVCPDEEFTAARFRDAASLKIDEISAGGKNIIIAGGTGLYIKALTEGIFEGPQADWEFRKSLVETAELSGRSALYERLKKVDPAAAANIHPNNLHRVVRALEVFELSQKPMSEFQKEHAFSERPYDALKIGLKKERDALYGDIDARVDQMIASGLLEETKRLLDMGFHSDLKPMCGLGYKEMCGYLCGEYPFDEAVLLIKRNTRRYAKRQITWFKKDPGIRWFHPAEKDCIIRQLKEFLN